MSDAKHQHDHGPRGHHHHGLVQRGAEAGRLKWVLVITALFMIAEVVGGLLSGSLALLADSGHMFTDVGALARRIRSALSGTYAWRSSPRSLMGRHCC